MAERYDDLSEIGKSLIDMLYNNQNNKERHILEDYIVAFDQNIDSNSTIRAIGDRIGIEIPHDAIAHEYLYDRLVDHIINHEINVTKRENSLTTKQVVNMTEQEYKKKYDGNYYDRLRQIREL